MHNDYFLYDTERLYSIASGEQVKEGLAYFNENRVIALEKENNRLIAQVEDADDEVCWVELSAGSDGALSFGCDCNREQRVCRHAIAALYRYADQYGQDDAALGSAVDEAIQERIKKGRNEVRVKLLSGNLGFGVWQAASLVSATYTQRAYQVQIRSLDQRMNYCTCPDLASNRLGTCKHIEAVLHFAKTKPEYQRLKDQGCPLSFVYLAWDSATRPVIRLQRAAQVEDDLSRLFAEFFDAHGVFSGRLPEDFFRFSQLVQGRDDFLLGDDAVQHVQQCAEDAAQAVRGQQISRTILQGNGVLPGIKVRLFPYQSEGVAFLASRGRALLADDMGLGKTLQAISAACWLADNAGVNRVLVVCPASLKHQWAREIAKFTGKTVQIVQGPVENRTVQYRADALFFIVNYELVLRDLTVIGETLKPDLLILDEAQRIKNWRTKLASTVKLIPSRYVFVLTGTPLENRLEDLYSLLQLVDVRVLGPLWRCLLDFHVTDERGKVVGYRNLSELRRRIAPVMLRRNRSLVSDQLPDRTEVVLDIPMNPKQQELHDSALTAAGRLATIAQKRPLTPSEQNRLMAALQQARMACNAAGLVDKQTQGSPKLDELARLLEELCLQSNRKAVVFSQWALMTEMVESLVRGMGLGCVRLHGGVPSHKRGELMEKFQQDDALQVFISTDAGGTGLNLQSASVLINLDMPWNPAVLDQRIARIHRLGQKQKVQIFLLLAEDSYEQHVARLVKGKRDLFDNVVDPDASEDVVGVSKKMLETLINDLALGSPKEIWDAADAGSSPAPATEIAESAGKQTAADESEEDARVRRLIEKIQTAFGDRIERIMAKGGGLLVVVRQWQDADEQSAQELSEADMPVAVMDARSLRSLLRLGSASPLAETRTLFETGTTETAPENPLLTVSAQKLRSAQVLMEQQCSAGVMDLLASALLLKVAAMNGQAQPPVPANAAVWLYGEILPRQLLTPEQAALVMQVVSLSQSPNLPETLIAQAWGDVSRLFALLS
ncbi:DEAD/DEAH box helicase [Candidatus Methylospira mobilis]|uniref:DEAD/DEAH box helicase n=1 Tax=Candidatus Methylospira mobilis TaxID=1808979 RepID=UPI0028E5CF38|nr:DEAD/DEAH box helicase [Candidatus Methylospira mobilis]WNV05939.1 DEAD/DEAH box helicase [Candidatus Methylospira mobilis]